MLQKYQKAQNIFKSFLFMYNITIMVIIIVFIILIKYSDVHKLPASTNKWSETKQM